MNCSNDAISDIRFFVDKYKTKHEKLSTIYEQCLKINNEESCRDIEKCLKQTEWNYTTWKQYYDDIRLKCKGL